ncbi:MAG: hypothetical protein MUC44_04595 [Beijerinckiaceae bacterium]|jgi:hypothetical protein|nr:hypothetical protein [Beijerinckiaceae bacterium]
MDMVTLDMLTLNEAGKRIVYMDARRRKFGNVPKWFPGDARLLDDAAACPGLSVRPGGTLMIHQRHVP